MTTRRSLWSILAALPALGLSRRARADAPDASPSGKTAPQTLEKPTVGAAGEILLTIFLRHDETKTVDEINSHLKETGWFRDFPPAGVEVVSWYVLMGVGQVVTLRFAADRLREINRLIEGEAWGGYRTEFYPTYDYRELYAQLRLKMR
jgi:hypothetical protein